jgi:hypothetical protein
MANASPYERQPSSSLRSTRRPTSTTGIRSSARSSRGWTWSSASARWRRAGRTALTPVVMDRVTIERWDSGQRAAVARHAAANCLSGAQALRRRATSPGAPGQTLQPTALVHDYLRLMKDRPDRWQNRAAFLRDRRHSARQIPTSERGRAGSSSEGRAATRDVGRSIGGGRLAVVRHPGARRGP